MQKDANRVELEKCCRTHIFLQNFVLIQPRTSPPQICKILLIIISPILLTQFCWLRPGARAPRSQARDDLLTGTPRSAGRATDHSSATPTPVRPISTFGSIERRANERQGSFSAVPKSNFARKYAFESSRRELRNALLCTALKSLFSPTKMLAFRQKIAIILFSESWLDFMNFAKSTKN